jgi:hypothetical protein
MSCPEQGFSTTAVLPPLLRVHGVQQGDLHPEREFRAKTSRWSSMKVQ